MIATLYLTRNGLLEPLGQSQVLPYLRGLSREYRITLITYEKDEDRQSLARMDVAAEECTRLGIRWLPQRFRSRHRMLAPFSMLRMMWVLRREALGQGARLIHARSYVPAAAALIVSSMSRVPFIFDMRALWPEELITAGRLRRGSILHRMLSWLERACLKRAGSVVSLTHAATDHLKRTYPAELAEKQIEVIPTCADLQRFVPADNRSDRRIIGCLGTLLSGWFRIDWLATFLAVAAEQDPDVLFELTTRDDADVLRDRLDPDGALSDRLQIAPADSQVVHQLLQQQVASVMFFTDGLGKIGSSPTRMAEILACGLPVVANEGVGDVARIIRKYRVGIIANGPDPHSMQAAWRDLSILLEDPDLSSRCRKAAEDIFSLEAGTAAFAEIYNRLTRTPSRCAG